MSTNHVKLTITKKPGAVINYTVDNHRYGDTTVALYATQWYEKAFRTPGAEHLDDKYAYRYRPKPNVRVVEMLFENMPDLRFTGHFVIMVRFDRDGTPLQCKLVAKEINIEDGIPHITSSDNGWMIFVVPNAA